MSGLAAVDLIRTVRDGERLSDEQIAAFIEGYTSGEIADEQASALLMAVFFRGLSAAELAVWTAGMINSGVRLDLSGAGRPTVDKHSTGGVGDKISLPLAPLVAACGAAVPMISGRGLGHTGGTLDKLDAISGFRTDLDSAAFTDQLREIGVVMGAAGDDLAPADRRLYALRDATATVESIPLIASSIMSKKIAEGTEALVLDVKVGTGAFMRNRDEAAELARTMIALGAAHGVRTRALLTDMSTPLGLTIGNALEVEESLEILSGGGPADVRELTLRLAAEMLDVAGCGGDPMRALYDGSAMDVWRAMIRAQGGDPVAPLPRAAEVEELRSERTGVVEAIDALGVGRAAWHLGAGRARKEDPVSAGAGVRLRVQLGDRVDEGQVVAELHADEPERMAAGQREIEGAIRVGRRAPQTRRVVLEPIRVGD